MEFFLGFSFWSTPGLQRDTRPIERAFSGLIAGDNKSAPQIIQARSDEQR